MANLSIPDFIVRKEVCILKQLLQDSWWEQLKEEFENRIIKS